MTELKPCPFCGSEVRRYTIGGSFPDSYPELFECTNPECLARIMFCIPMSAQYDKSDEIEKWNRRVNE